MSDGFLGRWSRRKLEARQGRSVDPDLPLTELPPADPVAGPEAAAMPVAVDPAEVCAQDEPGNERPAEVPPPTLEDVKTLTAESDFRRFAAQGVAPEVKNAALKKLFADPHFNVMDGMDVYVDDYSKPDPLPSSMLRQLASAQFLGLFSEEERRTVELDPAPRDDADNHTAQTVAQSGSIPDAGEGALSEPPLHADPDLQLQQDDAAPGKEPGRGAG
jgi:hypothetical protein